MLLGYNSLTLDFLTEDLDKNINEFLAKVELEGRQCHLNHGPQHLDIEEHNAINYICQNLGDTQSKTVTGQIRIPICEECINGLLSGEWLLVYCITCHSSQWIYKSESRLDFKEGLNLLWLDECPACESKQKEVEE